MYDPAKHEIYMYMVLLHIKSKHPDCSVGQWVKWANSCDSLSTLLLFNEWIRSIVYHQVTMSCLHVTVSVTTLQASSHILYIRSLGAVSIVLRKLSIMLL